MERLITYLQIFGIGFSFGMIGPCFFTCAPILITYVAGTKKEWRAAFKDIIFFLTGRLLAYVALGFIAGLSGAALRSFTSSSISAFFQPLAGAIAIFFAALILLYREDKECPHERGKILNFGGVFIFGFLMGLSPCAPLLALLFNVALMSRGALDGAFYTLFFGLGTFISGILTIGIAAGLLSRIPASVIKTRTVNTAFKIICALLLFILGLTLILK